MKQTTRTLITLVLAIVVTFSVALAQQPPVPADEARLNAGITLIEALTFRTPFLEEWSEVTLADPTLVFDPSGEPLLWEFPVVVYGREAGMVRAAATQLFGAGVIAIEATPRALSTQERMAAALDRFVSQHPQAEILGAVPVLYQQPRQAARVEFRVSGDERTQVDFIDLATLEPVVERGNGEPGSVRVISTFAMLRENSPHAHQEMYLHDADLNLAAANALVTVNVDPWLRSPLWAGQLADVQVVLASLAWNEPQTRVVDTSRLKLITQQTSTWCTRAVAQMIEFYHFGYTPRTQAQINTALNNLGWTANWISALRTYFRTYPMMIYSDPETNLTALTVSDSTKQETGLRNLQQEINHDVPFDDNIYGHSRMGVGYQVVNHNGVETRFYIGIYDPEPTTGGISWELGWTQGMFGVSPSSPVYRISPFEVRNFVWVP